jgi:MFS family permease
MILLFFLIFLAYNLFYATFSMYSSTELQWSAQKVGFFFTLLSAVMIIGQGPVLNALSSRYSEQQIFIGGSVVMALTFACFTSNNPIMLYLAAVLYGLGNGVMWPSFLTILSKVGDPNKQGSLQGIANSSGSLASILGLVFGGFLLALMSQSLYFISAGLLVVIVVIGIFYLKRINTASAK